MSVRSIIDKKALLSKLNRASRMEVEGSDFLLRRSLEELGERLGVIKRHFSKVLVLSPAGDQIADFLEQHGQVGDVDVVAVPRWLDENLGLDAASYDLVISWGHLNLVDDVPGAMIQSRLALKEDGLFLACVPGPSSLANLREAFLSAESAVRGGASPRVMPFFDIRDAGALLQRSGFALPVTDSDPVDVNYRSIAGLVRDLRSMGMTNVLADRSRLPMDKAFFSALLEQLDTCVDPETGRLPVRFELVFLSGWAPSAAQPKPLQPGSAKVSLRDVLGKQGESE